MFKKKKVKYDHLFAKVFFFTPMAKYEIKATLGELWLNEDFTKGAFFFSQSLFLQEEEYEHCYSYFQDKCHYLELDAALKICHYPELVFK